MTSSEGTDDDRVRRATGAFKATALSFSSSEVDREALLVRQDEFLATTEMVVGEGRSALAEGEGATSFLLELADTVWFRDRDVVLVTTGISGSEFFMLPKQNLLKI